MVAEFRRLVFSFEELQNALEFFHKEKKPILQNGEIVSIILNDNPTIFANVYTASDDEAEELEVRLDRNVLAAVILYYCRKIKIPIPRNSHKEIIRVGDNLALSISIGDDKIETKGH